MHKVHITHLLRTPDESRSNSVEEDLGNHWLIHPTLTPVQYLVPAEPAVVTWDKSYDHPAIASKLLFPGVINPIPRGIPWEVTGKHLPKTYTWTSFNVAARNVGRARFPRFLPGKICCLSQLNIRIQWNWNPGELVPRHRHAEPMRSRHQLVVIFLRVQVPPLVHLHNDHNLQT